MWNLIKHVQKSFVLKSRESVCRVKKNIEKNKNFLYQTSYKTYTIEFMQSEWIKLKNNI